MFGIGMPEMILILAVALIVIGPKKLPDLAKSLGRALGEFKKATKDFKESIDVEDNFKELKDVKNAFDDISTDIKETIDVDIKKEDGAQEASVESDKEETQETSAESDKDEAQETSEKSDKDEAQEASVESDKEKEEEESKGSHDDERG
jgi:sec-independent protein translocase protein TatB